MMRMIGLSFLFLALLDILVQVDTMAVSTPELFGDGTVYLVRSGEHLAGYIDAWGGWLIYGTADSCTITQISGGRIDGAGGGVPCFMDFMNDSRFRGWIDFRGHRRKFCGAHDADSFPRKCYGE